MLQGLFINAFSYEIFNRNTLRNIYYTFLVVFATIKLTFWINICFVR
nr:MAG TPA: hypothetical protein [Caudoviricetes sp.]